MHGRMTPRKPAAGPAFRTASDLLKEGHDKSENRRRLDSWAAALVRDRKIAPSWKEDDELAALVRSIADPGAPDPAEGRPGKPARRQK